MGSVCGQPRVLKGHRPDENQVSRTSCSWRNTTALPYLHSRQCLLPLPHCSFRANHHAIAPPAEKAMLSGSFSVFFGSFWALVGKHVGDFILRACMYAQTLQSGRPQGSDACLCSATARPCCAVLCCAVLCCAVLCKFAASLQAWSLERPMLCCCHAMIQGHSNYVSSKQAYIRCRRIRLLASLWIGKTHSILA